LPMAETLPTTTADLFKVIEVMLASKEKEFFRTETGFFEKITSISGLLEPAMSKDKKKAIIKEKLIEYNQDIPECVYLPTNQTCRVVGIVTNSGAPMQSAARVPILISF
jgi:phosphatidylinositol 4-kinase